jgi:hypothetical protein
MALSVDSTPLDYSSVHDDLWHVVTSDNSTAVDFKYVFDVFVGNKQLIRAKIFPNPENGTGYFNVSNIISNEMKFDWFSPNGEIFMKELNYSGEIFQSYTVRYGEDVSGITTLNMASGVTIAANCVPNLFGRRLITTSSVFDPTVKKFYTNRDKLNIKSNYGEDLYIGGALMANNSFLEVYQYNSAGTQLDYNLITIPSSITSQVYQLNISPTNLVDAGIVFNSECAYYEVEMWNRLPNPDVFLDKVRVYFDCNPKYEVINLHFMNNYGLFDTARFSCVSRLSMDAQRKTFEKPDYNFGNSVYYTNDWTTENDVNNIKYKESKINYGTQYQWTYKLTMNFPNDADYEWLAELIMSPQVWAEFVIDSENKEYYPVSIKATNYEYSKHINNGLRAFEVEIDMNQKRNGFRR